MLFAAYSIIDEILSTKFKNYLSFEFYGLSGIRTLTRCAFAPQIQQPFHISSIYNKIKFPQIIVKKTLLILIFIFFLVNLKHSYRLKFFCTLYCVLYLSLANSRIFYKDNIQ